jgi:hypothetical protein
MVNTDMKPAPNASSQDRERARAAAVTGVARRVGAGLAVGSAVLHALTVGGGTAMVVVMSAMVLACLYCAYELWTRDTLRSWVLVALMNLAMIAVHLPLATGHHHGAAVRASGPTTMTAATAVAALEVVVAVAVLFGRTRRVQLT